MTAHLPTLPLLSLIVVFIPLLASLFIGFSGRFFSRRGGNSTLFQFAVANLALLFTHFVVLLHHVIHGGVTFEFDLCEWIAPPLLFAFTILVDPLTVQMGLVVVVISSAVICYSFDYLGDDPHLPRFISYLFLFLFFMLFLVFSGNLLQLFIGWEGVGLVSFLLINFWFTRLEANRSAAKAIIFNRFGDIGFLFAIVLVVFTAGSVDLTILNGSAWGSVEEVILFLFFIGAVAKSAQLGLHAWLPDAMEGPTPVSALLHSATMVTVGVFLLLRLAPLIARCSITPLFIGVGGGLTALAAAAIALFQKDIKKIIAYSTCSQLGLLMGAIGTFNFSGSFFHLTTHAFFKALLFLTAGAVIHALVNEQDTRRMGGLANYLPLTLTATAIGTMGLVGFPFLSGFYSKEFILFNLLAFTAGGVVYKFIFTTCFLASILTILYSIKLFHLVFLTSYRGGNLSRSLLSVTDSPLITNAVLVTLSLLTLFFGYAFADLYIGFGNNLLWEVFPPLFAPPVQIELFSTTQKNLLVGFVFLVFLSTPIWRWVYGRIHRRLRRSLSPSTLLRDGSRLGVLYLLYLLVAEKLLFSAPYRFLVNLYYRAGYWIVLGLDRGLFENISTNLALSLGRLGRGLVSSSIGSLSSALIFLLLTLTFLASLVIGSPLITRSLLLFALLVTIHYLDVLLQSKRES